MMALIAMVFQNRSRRHLRRERIFRDRNNPLDSLRDNEILRNYRFTRSTIYHLIDLVSPILNHPTRRNHALSCEQQLLIGLRFFATGAPQHVFAEIFGVERSTICKVISDVIRAFKSKVRDYIIFPSTREAVTDIKQKFYRLAEFPNAIGIIDCTHIRLFKAPLKESEPVYVNRKRWHSINTQIICDADYRIIHIVARWPGSAHDNYIFTSSSIGQNLENAGNEGMGCLLGDSGYYQRPWLMTPFENPTTDSQRRYNKAHRRGRALIEQVNGQFKQKFPCLVYGLRMKPEKACSVILACAVLYNISKQSNEPDVFDIDEGRLGNDVDVDRVLDERGLLHRDLFAVRHFS